MSHKRAIESAVGEITFLIKSVPSARVFLLDPTAMNPKALLALVGGLVVLLQTAQAHSNYEVRPDRQRPRSESPKHTFVWTPCKSTRQNPWGFPESPDPDGIESRPPRY